MSLKEVCRACLCSDRIMSLLLESIVPKIDSPPDFVLDMWKLFTKMLITHENGSPDKICVECLDEIHRTYSFMLKCDQTNDSLKKMKKMCLNAPTTDNVRCEHDSSTNIKSENAIYEDISQIKTENIELIESNNEDENDEVFSHANVNQVDPQLQSPLIVKLEEVNLREKKSNEPDSESDTIEDNASFIQDVKQEPELDVCMEKDDFNEIESEDKRSTKILKCFACQYECGKMESMEKHLIKKHIEGQVCKLCSKEFQCTAIKHCLIHLNVIQGIPKSTDIKRHKCEVCLKKFRRKSDLTTHLVIHTGEIPFKCEICLKGFRVKHQLTHHLKCHAIESPFKCELCPKSFLYKSILMDHLRCHTGERPFKCKICSKTFGHKSHLTRHLSCHTGERPFKCEICSKTFQHNNHLTEHLRCHTGERPFKCEICPKTFGHRSHLTRHSTSHTGERPFKCDTCLKDFQVKSHLTDHLRCHTGERPFKCDICPKTFPHKSSLTEHLRCHTGDRPYKCEICMKTFQYRNNLRNHRRCHMDEGSFKCESCPKVFAHKRSLTKHLKRHMTE